MLFEDYSFVLEWNDIDEDTREAKIDDYITFNYNNGEYDTDKDEEKGRGLDDHLEDEGNREDAENDIKSHFPIYF